MNNKLTSALAVMMLVLVGFSCSYFSAKPSGTVKKFYRHVEAGELDAAMALLSHTSAVAMLGPAKVKAGLAEQTRAIKNKKGISSIDIQDEQINGETASVSGTVKFGDGTSESFSTVLMKEDGTWKITK